MTTNFASSDDSLMWSINLSSFGLPVVTAADELGLFATIGVAPGSIEEVARRTGLNRRALRAVLPMLAAQGLLLQRGGRYYLTETARNYLLPEAPHYWGPVMAVSRKIPVTHEAMMGALRNAEESSRWDVVEADKEGSRGWTEGGMPTEFARAIANYMNANALPSAWRLAEVLDLSATRHLLDVGSGSGIFSIAFATANPNLRCSLLDLLPMCDVAMESVRAAKVADRVDAAPRDMFREAWPTGHDAIFFSNVFHDWDLDTCRMLARNAHESLPPGGRIHVHEMLLDDGHDGPLTVAAFSLLMLLQTKGQQFSVADLQDILRSAGFRDVGVLPSHGFYAVVTAIK